MKFSIITINSNNANGLLRTIHSVITQTYRDFEYIVIDGGSSDNSKQIIDQFQKKIDYWVSEPDGGIYAAMNKGTNVAKGDYCIYMNSGDVFYSETVLEKVIKQNLQEDIISGDLAIDDLILQSPDHVTLKVFYKRSLYHQATFIKTSLIKAHPYDENLKGAADWKFFLETLIFQNATYKHINITIANFERGGYTEQHGNSRSEVNSELIKLFPQRILDDYYDYCYGSSPYRKMMNQVEIIPPIKKIIFNINVLILKIINVRLKSKWIKEL